MADLTSKTTELKFDFKTGAKTKRKICVPVRATEGERGRQTEEGDW